MGSGIYSCRHPAEKEDFEKLIAKAEQFDVDNIIDFHRAISNQKKFSIVNMTIVIL
ncbi:MAG: hypothetical protein IBX72_09985 [Nitrospirae bacterium]|nr:hypothetical protein [Nitrospirota bacterium]